MSPSRKEIDINNKELKRVHVIQEINVGWMNAKGDAENLRESSDRRISILYSTRSLQVIYLFPG